MKRLFIFTLISLLILGTMACKAVNIQPNEEITQNETSSNIPEEKDDAHDSDDSVNVKPDNDNTNNSKPEENKAENNPKEQSKNKVVTIYFSDSDGLRLVGEERTIDNITVEALINELIKGPQNPDNNKTIPDGTKLLGTEIKDKTAYVNFSKELKDNHWGGSTGELFTIFSIVNTLVLQPDLDIERVQILIEGQTVETLTGHADISMPLEADLQMVDMK